ncbi:MAG: MBL fold metallo-hydrolase [Deltaproteobacteria bacterium]|nr:MBL fold metallo-hydrolase [Deltaproteobacteria bacterium]MBW2019338.1 MBL fold metallo-hydrolase [Deltaproteobacteria bacterium]MBW2075849.1 MBL fold metallo-hydrolase [Deltaproteobacteria bacterium]RLB82317.1 MAG: MBL fold metallo-hydrolase [Deltaproteobacteria bacterium]
MKITILGSGTCVPSLKRSSCSVLIEIAQNLLLFDSGAGTMKRLLEAGVTIDKLSHIFYSHLHPDHTGELVPFLFASKYPQTYRPRKPFTIVAAKGFTGFYEKLKLAYGEWIELAPGLLKILELDTKDRDHLDCGLFDVDSLPMDHTDMSLAYRITTPDGRSVVYSGDTDLCDNLVTLAKGVDVLICESALPDDMKVPGHLTPSLAGKVATQAGVKKLVLTHFYPECDSADVAKQCRKTYRGPLVLAEDLMEIALP